MEALPEVAALKVALRNNLALIDLKRGNFPDAIKNCNLALELDKGNVKALFRKGRAQRLLQSFEEAEETLKSAVELDGQNAEVVAELAQLKKDKADFASKEKSMYGNLFAKGNLY